VTQIAGRSLDLPFGTHDLNPEVVLGTGPVRAVRCFVRGCTEFLEPPSQTNKGTVCPVHGVRCHVSGGAGTYSYPDPRRNVIASRELFARNILHHPFKFESHRMGYERSEDAVTWNVFRSLFEQQTLAMIAARLIGEQHAEEPELYLWGISMTTFRPWPLLIEARQEFESHLPVKRPYTEPDIALHLPGRYLLLIEAKLTSPNTFYERGPRKDDRSLTFHELLNIYQFRGMKIADPRSAREAKRLPYQLWRNMVFAEWMAKADCSTTKAFHVNLVRHIAEYSIESEFRRSLCAGVADRFRRATWETIHSRIAHQPSLYQLREYLCQKTVGLQKAFLIP